MPAKNQSTLPIRIVLADDHDILRQGLKLLLGLQPEMQIVGEARTGREAITMAKSLTPDVIVMDISMPDMDGFEACKIIHTNQPDIQILMLTMHESEEYFLQALRMGASGYLVKKAAPADLQVAVQTVARGEAFLYPGLAKTLIRAYVSSNSSTNSSVIPAERTQEKATSLAQELQVLTPRELEVLTMVAEGCTNQEIADQLVLSIKTVQAHRANVMDKLGLQDITRLVRFAIRHGIIHSDI